MKNFRYKGKTCKHFGVNTEFMKSRFDSTLWTPKLDLPIPWNVSEIKLLSKFIFGLTLNVTFDSNRIHDSYLEKLIKDKLFERATKINNLSPDKKDYFVGGHYGKMTLLYMAYKCEQIHSNYYDHKFNQEVFGSCYEMDSSFWRHCIGELSCGGIATHCYGQIQVTSLSERKRLLNMINNPNQDARQEFIDELNKLKELDKKYEKSEYKQEDIIDI